MSKWVVWLCLLPFTTSQASAQLPTIFVSRPGQIMRLTDLNGDGDYLDFGESVSFASGLPTNLGAIAARGMQLLVVGADNTGGRLYLVQDLDGDGDAFEAGEVVVYAELLGAPAALNLTGLACGADGVCYSVDTVLGNLYRFEDLNGDGDALDAGEVTIAATGLTGATSLAMRPDGKILVATSSGVTPVRILADLNGDGDFLGFAENISYGEGFTAGSDITASNSQIAYLPAAGRISKLADLTHDDDVLDFGEVTDYALVPSASKLTTADGDVYVVDTTGNIYRLRDLQSDGDALDFDETVVVGQGLSQCAGVVAVSTVPTCIGGDLDGNSVVNLGDLQGFANGLLGIGSPPETCRMDVNGDGVVDGRDIRGFVAKALL